MCDVPIFIVYLIFCHVLPYFVTAYLNHITETMDIVAPQVQEVPPSFGETATPRHASSSGSGGASVNLPLFATVSTSAYVSELPRSESEGSLRGGGHMYLQLPVRVIFGQPITPHTVQPYWFAISKDV